VSDLLVDGVLYVRSNPGQDGTPMPKLCLNELREKGGPLPLNHCCLLAYIDICNVSPSEQIKDMVQQAILLSEWKVLDGIGRNLVPDWGTKYEVPR
jgi:hypothetical protein